MTARRSSPARPQEAGFTLVEMLVSLAVMVIVILGVLLLFDFNGKLARAQTQVAEMQQSQRVAHTMLARNLRTAGRGRLPLGNLPSGVAVEVRNNVGTDSSDWPSTDIAIGFDDSPQVAVGTDVLVVRGIFSAPIYQINHTDSTTFSKELDAGVVVGGTLRIPNVSHTGVSQPTDALIEALGDPAADPPRAPAFEALVLSSPVDDRIFGLVELDPEGTRALEDPPNPDNLQLAFKYADGENTDQLQVAMQALTGTAAFPATVNIVAFAGIVEEYRFYVREEPGLDGEPVQRLSMARMYPFTEIPYKGDVDNARIDLADNIADLQLALGVDLDNDGQVPRPADYEDGDGDEWLYDHPSDETDDAPADWNPRRLFYVRMTTLARTERRDWNYQARPIEQIEDREYGEESAFVPETHRENRMYHRRQLETVVDLRNLS